MITTSEPCEKADVIRQRLLVIPSPNPSEMDETVWEMVISEKPGVSTRERQPNRKKSMFSRTAKHNRWGDWSVLIKRENVSLNFTSGHPVSPRAPRGRGGGKGKADL